MKVEIALVIYGLIMCSKCAFGIYFSELFGNGEDKDPVKDKVMKSKFQIFQLHIFLLKKNISKIGCFNSYHPFHHLPKISHFYLKSKKKLCII